MFDTKETRSVKTEMQQFFPLAAQISECSDLFIMLLIFDEQEEKCRIALEAPEFSGASWTFLQFCFK